MNSLKVHTLKAEDKEEYKFKNAIKNIENDKNVYIVYVYRFRFKGNYKYYVGTTNNFDRRDEELSETREFKDYKADENIFKSEYIKDLEKAFHIEEFLEEEINETINARKQENKLNYDYLEKRDIENMLKIYRAHYVINKVLR